jgi:hypothetical protein
MYAAQASVGVVPGGVISTRSYYQQHSSAIIGTWEAYYQ